MKTIRHTDADFAERLRELTAPSSLFHLAIEERARAIIDAVKTRGDEIIECPSQFEIMGCDGDARRHLRVALVR